MQCKKFTTIFQENQISCCFVFLQLTCKKNHQKEDNGKSKNNSDFPTFLCIGNLYTLSVVPSKLPSMKGALNAVAHHPSSHCQVGTQVRAVGVQHRSLPFLAPEHHHLFT